MSHSHPRRVGRLPRWQKIATHLVFTLCALSGILFFATHDLQLALPGLASRSYLVMHGVSASLALLALGAVMPAHIRAAWHARRNLTTGIALTLVLSVLTVSGLLLYYGSEDWRETVVWSHWLIGGLGLAVFPLHFVWGQRLAHNAAHLVAVKPQPLNQGAHLPGQPRR